MPLWQTRAPYVHGQYKVISFQVVHDDNGTGRGQFVRYKYACPPRFINCPANNITLCQELSNHPTCNKYTSFYSLCIIHVILSIINDNDHNSIPLIRQGVNLKVYTHLDIQYASPYEKHKEPSRTQRGTLQRTISSTSADVVITLSTKKTSYKNAS